jgi:hypothetical protein
LRGHPQRQARAGGRWPLTRHNPRAVILVRRLPAGKSRRGHERGSRDRRRGRACRCRRQALAIELGFEPRLCW